MKQEHLFKLSAMSIALFGVISQGYALECKIPMSVDSPNGSLDNCKLDTEATSNLLFNQSALLDISSYYGFKFNPFRRLWC